MTSSNHCESSDAGSLHVDELVSTITERVRQTINELSEGDILTSLAAFDLAGDVIAQDAVNRGVATATLEFRRHARKAHLAAFSPVRELLASQLIGLTFQEVIETTYMAVKRFLGRTELDIVPKPTKAYSGECQPHDLWNLLCNLFSASMAAKEIEEALTAPEDLELLRNLRRSEQMLVFLNHDDVVRVEDIDGKPYDGRIREPEWLARATAICN